jgi:cytochrome c1
MSTGLKRGADGVRASRRARDAARLVRAAGRVRSSCRAALLLVVATLAACAPPPPRADRLVPDGEPSRGIVALRGHGCGGCHVIPGLPETRGAVGPGLGGLATRAYIAGRMTNAPMNLVRWIKEPRTVDPGTVMPTLGVTDREARDIAAYLYSVDAGPPTGPPWPPTTSPQAETPIRATR